MRRIGAEALAAAIREGGELAILDAREEGEFGTGHLFLAVPCPLSRCEITSRALLTRPDVPVVCVDDAGGVAERLAAWLAASWRPGSGCTNVAVLDGGTQAWKQAGFVLFQGVNVPSKAFGEWVEHHFGTESVDPPRLKAWLDAGHDDDGRRVVVLDSRPFDEFVRMTIPTAIDVPGGELVYRVGELVADPETTIVVNCAGRTRSILGAESLRRAGIPNRVLALRNGTMGWELAGLSPARGRTERFSPGTPASLPRSLAQATLFAETSGVGVIGELDLARFEADPERTLYVLDVRDPEEFQTGHRPGSRSAPGGQLIQATDRWIGVRGSRIVVIDDTGVRARMAAAWLRQMGHVDVFVLEDGRASLSGGLGVSGPAPVLVPELAAPFASITPDELAMRLDEDGLVVVDVGRSLEFREGHVPGAVWGVRTRLGGLSLEAAALVVVASPDGVLAQLALPELADLTPAEIRVLAGGTEAWRERGHPMAADRTLPPDEACVDAYLRPYDRNSGVAAAMQAYLDWEIALVDQLVKDGTVRFGVDVAI